MPRYRLTLEYDGSAFVGWQRQSNGLTVQQVLEEAVAIFDEPPALVYGAGRTDAGVHALAQVAHVDLKTVHDPETVRNAINFHTKPHPVAVLAVNRVADDFHARYDAISRHYRYRILNRRARPALEEGRVWWVPRRLDVEAMTSAAHLLVGEHDFTSFRATLCQAKTPVKTLDQLVIRQAGDSISIEVSARSFLHNQVRIIVGSLSWVGVGRWSRDDLKAALDARARAAGGPTAPAEGLYLTGVDYPVDETEKSHQA